MIILDTNVISESMRPQPDARVVAWLGALNGEIAITAITLAELLTGIARLPESARKRSLARAVETALEPYHGRGIILPFDDAAAGYYAQIVAARTLTGAPIATADAQIAAICRVHRATCATRNVDDFAHTGIDVLNPWDLRA